MSESLLQGDDVSAVVFDIGSSALRAGYGGLYPSPQWVVPSHVAVDQEHKTDGKRFYSGIENFPREDVELKKFIEKSQIIDWDLFEHIFEDAYKNGLKFDPTSTPIFFTESNVYDQKHREKLAELMFEKYNAIGICVMPTAPLVLMKRNATTGVIIDVNVDQTIVSLVNHGFLLRKSVSVTNIGSKTICDLCAEMLTQKGINFVPKAPSNISVHPSYVEFRRDAALNDFARTYLHCQKKPLKQGLLSTTEIKATLGKSHFTLTGEEQTKHLEVFFDPTYSNNAGIENFTGLFDLLKDTVDKGDADSLMTYYSHIYTNGEGSVFKGFIERMAHEVSRIPPRYSARLNQGIKTFDPINSAWKQASIFVGTGTSNQLWVSKTEFLDNPTKIHYF